MRTNSIERIWETPTVSFINFKDPEILGPILILEEFERILEVPGVLVQNVQESSSVLFQDEATKILGMPGILLWKLFKIILGSDVIFSFFERI